MLIYVTEDEGRTHQPLGLIEVFMGRNPNFFGHPTFNSMMVGF